MSEEENLEALINRVADRPVPLLRLASLVASRGNHGRARELCDRALALAPENGEVRALAAEVLSHGVPDFYFTMVLDLPRHRLYEAAFREAIRPGCRVLDIGTGTGLFAMMAARAGAGEVISCEGNVAVAEAASEVIARNKLSDRVRVVGKGTSDLEVGVDMDGPADVVVWDNLARNLLGAGVLPAIEQAARRLARPGARFIPAHGSIRVALAEDPDPHHRKMGTIEGFDLSPFNRLAPPHHGMVRDTQFILRGEPADLFSFDFESGGPFPEARASATLSSAGGRVNGIAQWVRLELGDGIAYENAPPRVRVASLGPVFYPFSQPMTLPQSGTLTVHGSHDRTSVRVWI
jgi:type II protein arginine methyltransferase